MKETGILFTPEMSRKIDRGEKTQTRRIIKPTANCPYGQVGDFLYVKEPFIVTGFHVMKKPQRQISGIYLRDQKSFSVELTEEEHKKWISWKYPTGKGKSSLFMFKSLARLWLEITRISVEKLQDITDEQIQAEGVEVPQSVKDAARYMRSEYDCVDWDWRDGFRELWDSIWESNPLVWVIEFKKRQDGVT